MAEKVVQLTSLGTAALPRPVLVGRRTAALERVFRHGAGETNEPGGWTKAEVCWQA